MDNRYYFSQIDGDIVEFSESESNHISRVRRCSVGEKIMAFNGDGYDYELELTGIAKSKVRAKVLKKALNRAYGEPKIVVYLAMLKNEALTETIDQLAELNVSEVKLFRADYSIANIDKQKLDKLNAISIQASKQCERATIMRVSIINKADIKKDIGTNKNVFFASVNADTKPTAFSGDFSVIIGAEGGFSPEEIEYFSSFSHTISLGKTVLRARVASISAVSILKAVNHAC